MFRLKKIIYVLIMIVFIIIIFLSSCSLSMSDGFNNKEEIISIVKVNIDDLNKLTKELTNEFHIFNIIENSNYKTFYDSYEYKTELSNRLFKILRIRYVSIEENRVKYVVKK